MNQGWPQLVEIPLKGKVWAWHDEENRSLAYCEYKRTVSRWWSSVSLLAVATPTRMEYVFISSLNLQMHKKIGLTKKREGPKDHSALCSSHFKEHCFEAEVKHAESLGLEGKRKLDWSQTLCLLALKGLCPQGRLLLVRSYSNQRRGELNMWSRRGKWLAINNNIACYNGMRHVMNQTIVVG